MGESIYQETPVFVRLAKIYRTVHCFHPFCFQPFPCSIKKKESRLFVIDALKESNTSCWLVIFKGSIIINKCSYSTGQSTFFIFQDPAFSLTMLIKHILHGIENV